jgi:hypothetical protein
MVPGETPGIAYVPPLPVVVDFPAFTPSVIRTTIFGNTPPEVPSVTVPLTVKAVGVLCGIDVVTGAGIDVVTGAVVAGTAAVKVRGLAPPQSLISLPGVQERLAWVIGPE